MRAQQPKHLRLARRQDPEIQIDAERVPQVAVPFDSCGRAHRGAGPDILLQHGGEYACVQQPEHRMRLDLIGPATVAKWKDGRPRNLPLLQAECCGRSVRQHTYIVRPPRYKTFASVTTPSMIVQLRGELSAASA